MNAAYVSARWEDRGRALHVRKMIRTAGLETTSTWMDEDASNSMEGIRERPEHARAIELRDLEEIDRCDVLVCLVPPLDIPWRGTGGRHVEMGYALAKGKRVIVVGPRENVFHFDARVRWIPTEAEFYEVLPGI